MLNRHNSRLSSKYSESPDKIKLNYNKNELSNKNLNSNTNELHKNKYNQKPKTTENVQRIH